MYTSCQTAHPLLPLQPQATAPLELLAVVLVVVLPELLLPELPLVLVDPELVEPPPVPPVGAPAWPPQAARRGTIAARAICLPRACACPTRFELMSSPLVEPQATRMPRAR